MKPRLMYIRFGCYLTLITLHNSFILKFLMNIRERTIDTLNTLVESFRGSELSNQERDLLKRSRQALEESTGNRKMLKRLLQFGTHGFFHAAAEGRTFADPERIREKFGQPLNETYPDASEEFMKVARTYWSLKLLLADPELLQARQSSDELLYDVLDEIDRSIGPVFFPAAGPEETPATEERKDKQEKMIRESNADIDLDAFMDGNPFVPDDA